MGESPAIGVLFAEFRGCNGETATLEHLLSASNCRISREECAGVECGARIAKAIAAESPSLCVFSVDAAALAPNSGLWEALRIAGAATPIIVAAVGMEPQHIRALFETGINDFVVPPFDAANVLPRVWRAIAREDRQSGPEGAAKTALLMRQFGLIGESPAFLTALGKLPPVASCDVTVLVSGETGTGKELIARAIHYLSNRRDQPFVPVDCGAIPPELAESELFGHERGAFTGAVNKSEGLVAAARDGTIFLDEVDSLPFAVQAKLLRFLQQKEYRPLGSVEVRRANVRVISATNRDLRELVQSAQFREDLFYRLNVVQLRLPPLRERPADVALLARHFIAKYRAEFYRPAHDLSAGAMQALLLYRWPGNVRELENVIQAAVALCESPLIAASDLRFSAGETDGRVSFRQAKAEAVTEFERDYIERLLRANGGNISEAARAAKKNRRAFWQLMRKYGIETRDFKQPAADRPPAKPVEIPARRCVTAKAG